MINNIKDIFINNVLGSMISNTFESSVNIEKTSFTESKYNFIKKDTSYLLYLHIPFCDNLCPFCTFHKYKYSYLDSIEYFRKLRKEIKILKSFDVKIDSIYIGGGSPLINEREIIKTIELLKDSFGVTDISCETDPNHIELETIKKLKGLVNRLSIGVQSFDNKMLKQLNRYEKFGKSEELIQKIEKITGILPITNIDLIFNLPNQTKEILIKDIDIAKSLKVEQITTYPLMSSSLNSKFLNKFQVNKNKEEFYNLILEQLSDFNMNNMWSFSKEKVKLSDEYVSKYNEYIGLGSGAFSYLQGNLFINSFDLKTYSSLLEQKEDPIIAKSQFNEKNIIQYNLLCTLFSGSFELDFYNKVYNKDLQIYLKKEFYLLKKLNIIYIKENTIYLTKKGRYVLVVLMANFYSQMDKVRALFKKQQFK